jgi:hypothetical protein
MEKSEVIKIILSYLGEEPFTQIASLRKAVENELIKQGVMGVKNTGNQYMRTTWNEPIPNKEALLINEVVYDLIYERVLTPGINRDNLELPFVHVSDKKKLNEKMSTILNQI